MDEAVDVEFPSSSTHSQTVRISTNYKRAVLADLLGADGLLVVSKGLGCQEIIAKALKLYCVPTSLVFVLNANNDAASFRGFLSAEGTAAGRAVREWNHDVVLRASFWVLSRFLSVPLHLCKSF